MRRAGIGRLEACLLAAASLLLVAALSWIAARRELWYDELFSWYVSGLPGPGALLRALLAGADNGPPLDYLLRHFAMAAFGHSAWAFRLPSVLALWGVSLSLYALLRAGSGWSGAAFAALAPLATVAFAYGAEGRAYAPLLASLALSLWAFQRADDDPRPRRLALLAASLFVGPFLHFHGVLNFLPPACAELQRTLRRRAARPAVLAAILAPALGAVLLWPFARNALRMRAAFWADDYGFQLALSCYPALLGPALWLLLPLALWGLARTPRSSGQRTVALVCALFPLGVLGLAALGARAMTERYAIGLVVGCALLAGQGVAELAARRRVFGLLALALLAALGAQNAWRTAQAATAPALAPEFAQLVQSARLPVVFDSPQKFLESYQRLPPALRPRLVYLLDREASRARLGFDNDELALSALRLVEPVPVRERAPFVAEQDSFLLLLSGRRYWLHETLRAEGWQLSAHAAWPGTELLLCRAPQ